MKSSKASFSQEDGASFVLYEKIRIEPLRSSERMTLVDVDGNKAALARQYFQLGNQYFKKNEYKASISYFQSSLKYSYQSPETHNNLGVLHALIHQQERSIEYFKKSIQLRPRQIFAFINLANMMIKRGEFASGIELYLDLMSQYKEKRIMDNFSKFLNNYNNFYKFVKKSIRSAHVGIEVSTLEDILRIVLEKIPKDTSMVPQLFSSQISEEQLNVSSIKNIYEQIKMKYSKLHWNHLKSSFNKSIMYGLTLQQYLHNQDKSLSKIVCQLFSYVFIDKEDASLGFYFNSLMKGLERSHLQQFMLQLYINYTNLKRIKLLPYLKESKIIQQWHDHEPQKQQVIITIQRLYFHEKHYMYLLHDILHLNKDGLEAKLGSLADEEIQVLAKACQQCHNFRNAAYFFYRQYRKRQKQSYCLDYQFQTSTLTTFRMRHVLFIDQTSQEYLNQLEKQLDSEQCPISRQVQIIAYKAFTYALFQDYQRAISICQEARQRYSRLQDKFYQYIGSIHLLEFDSSFKNSLPNYELFKKTVNMLQESMSRNPKNQQAHFQLYCCLYRKNKRIALKHLIRAIQANPKKLGYYAQLSFAFTQCPEFQNQIKQLIIGLGKQYTRAIDFKVKGNIAIFHLFTENYVESYTFFKNSLKQAGQQNDTNCQDLLFMYFVSKLFWLYFKYIDIQYNYRFQCGFYLIIFLKAPFLFEKYDQSTYQCEEKIFRQIQLQLAEQLEENHKGVIRMIQHFDIQHKNILYPYIFTKVFKRKRNFRLDPMTFYADFIKAEPQLRDSVWIYEIVGELKQDKLSKIKELISSIYTNNNDLDSEQSKKIKKFILNLKKGKAHYKGQLQTFYDKHKYLLAHIDPQISTQLKRMIETEKTFISNLNIKEYRLSYRVIKSTLQTFNKNTKEMYVILFIFQSFHYFFQENNRLQQLINMLCKSLLKSHDLNQLYLKLKNYVFEDYVSSNSYITIFNSPISSPSPITSQSPISQHSLISSGSPISSGSHICSDSPISSGGCKDEQQCIEQGQTIGQEILSFDQAPILNQQCFDISHRDIFWTQDFPAHSRFGSDSSSTQAFIFAVKLVQQLEKQSLIVLELSLSDFRITDRQIIFLGIKKTLKLQNNQSKCKTDYNKSKKMVQFHLKTRKPEWLAQMKSASEKLVFLLKKIKKEDPSRINNIQSIMKSLHSASKNHHFDCLQELYNQLQEDKNLPKLSKLFNFYTKLLLSRKISYSKFIEKVPKVFEKPLTLFDDKN